MRGGDGVVQQQGQNHEPSGGSNLHHDTLDLMKFVVSKLSPSNLRLESCSQSFIQAGLFLFFYFTESI